MYVFAEHKNELPRNLCVNKNKTIWIEISTKVTSHQEEGDERGGLVITAGASSLIMCIVGNSLKEQCQSIFKIREQ